MDIRNCNLVDKRIKQTPNYPLDMKAASISLYLNRQQDLIIFGNADNNYIVWASLTKASDKAQNQAIFNCIANESFSMVSVVYKAVQSMGLAFEELKTWHRSELTRVSSNNMAWQTPFGHYYGQGQVQNNGKYFANNAAGYLDTLLTRCRFRDANGAYEAVLDYCIEQLEKGKQDTFHYVQVEPLIAMLRKEDYLILSDHEKIRNKYIHACRIADELYGQYMQAVR